VLKPNDSAQGKIGKPELCACGMSNGIKGLPGDFDAPSQFNVGLCSTARFGMQTANQEPELG
jgi:hypothetical protein